MNKRLSLLNASYLLNVPAWSRRPGRLLGHFPPLACEQQGFVDCTLLSPKQDQWDVQ